MKSTVERCLPTGITVLRQTASCRAFIGLTVQIELDHTMWIIDAMSLTVTLSSIVRYITFRTSRSSCRSLLHVWHMCWTMSHSSTKRSFLNLPIHLKQHLLSYIPTHRSEGVTLGELQALFGCWTRVKASLDLSTSDIWIYRAPSDQAWRSINKIDYPLRLCFALLRPLPISV